MGNFISETDLKYRALGVSSSAFEFTDTSSSISLWSVSNPYSIHKTQWETEKNSKKEQDSCEGSRKDQSLKKNFCMKPLVSESAMAYLTVRTPSICKSLLKSYSDSWYTMLDHLFQQSSLLQLCPLLLNLLVPRCQVFQRLIAFYVTFRDLIKIHYFQWQLEMKCEGQSNRKPTGPQVQPGCSYLCSAKYQTQP